MATKIRLREKLTSEIFYRQNIPIYGIFCHMFVLVSEIFYGEIYEQFDTCANSGYQALLPHREGPGDEANFIKDMGDSSHIHG